MIRLWFKDNTYMDVRRENAWQYESQPDWDHTEDLEEGKDYENNPSIQE